MKTFSFVRHVLATTSAGGMFFNFPGEVLVALLSAEIFQTTPSTTSYFPQTVVAVQFRSGLQPGSSSDGSKGNRGRGRVSGPGRRGGRSQRFLLNREMRDYVENGNLSGAKGVFEDMKQIGVKPDVVSYNTLLGGLVFLGMGKAIDDAFFRGGVFLGGKLSGRGRCCHSSGAFLPLPPL
ncbi:unnamed protein product [Amoebophrya sp. A120]|nr:unnamed protein product [Amoebophrya sp. A120]|eukprot:GSA120T00007488001.1